jgi:hypothetical protein
MGHPSEDDDDDDRYLADIVSLRGLVLLSHEAMVH